VEVEKEDYVQTQERKSFSSYQEDGRTANYKGRVAEKKNYDK